MSHSHTQGFGPLTYQEKSEGSKVEPDLRRTACGVRDEADASFSAVVRVNQTGYVIPDYVTLRAWITSRTFTCQLTPPGLRRLEQDPAVTAISRSTRLRME